MIRVKEGKNSYAINIRKTDRLNAFTGEILKDQLLRIVCRKKKSVILSLSGIKFIDSSGFEAIMTIVRNAREHDCSFRICDVSQEVYELIRLMKAQVVFEINPEKAPAFSSCD
jgi:anti-anti-sigma factor